MVASLRESNDELAPSDVAFSILKKWQLEKLTKRSGSLKYLHGVLKNDLGLDKAAELLDTRSTKTTTGEGGVCRYLFCERDSEYCFPQQRFFQNFGGDDILASSCCGCGGFESKVLRMTIVMSTYMHMPTRICAESTTTHM